MKILVTGGAGFIASHIVDAYIAAGHEVVIIDNLITGLKSNINPAAKTYFVDIRDKSIADIFAQEKPVIVNHHAAQIDVRRSVQDPQFDAEVNILGSLNILEAARKNGTEHIIFASTGGAIYGEQDYFPADEQHPLRPLSPYGIAKLSVEKYLSYYWHVYNLPFTVLRYANVYGPRQNPKGEAGVVCIFCEKMLKNESPTINGEGTQTRDYVYVGDVVNANVAVLAHREAAKNGIFNVGTSVETDVVTLFERLNQLLGSSLPKQHGPFKAGEQLRSVLNYQLTNKTLDWQPKVDLTEGLRTTIQFYKDLQ